MMGAVTETTTLKKQKMNTVTLINPWSKVAVEKSVSEIAANIEAYPWPEEIINKLDCQCDTDAEWVVEAVKLMGAEQAGVVIIGS